nr:thiosulfate oxidation carrier protein SoxY [Hyphomicrobium methylovorum]
MDRRSFLVSASAASCMLASIGRVAAENASAPERSLQFDSEFQAIIGSATPVEHGLTVDLPERADNGNFVPITISVESPMTDADYVKTIHLLSTANPVAGVARFHLSPLNGVARVQSRLRLAKSQDVVTLAELSTGDMLIATSFVKVLIGGCGL